MADRHTYIPLSDRWAVIIGISKRVLFESGRDYTAVSELKEATELDPENARAFYYLGQAIRAMVEHETLAKAEEASAIYLAKGAPLGQEDEVREFLVSRGKKE